MGETSLSVNGFLFSNNKEYNDAKQEKGAIEHFKNKLDLSNPREALKLYNKILEKQSFRTPVGYLFLKELQDFIIKSEIIKIEDMQEIYIFTENANVSYNNDFDSVSLNHYKELFDTEKMRHRNSRIINIFLVIIIMAMMYIALKADKTEFSDFENKVINKYSTWEEELTTREQKLNEREEKLNALESGN